MRSDNEWTVGRWMSEEVHTVRPTSDLVDAFEIMRLYRVRHVPVVEGRSHLIGIVSDRDIRHAIPMQQGTGERMVYGKALFDTPVEGVMHRHPITVTPDTPVREAGGIICREKVGALPVVEDDRLVGIISAEDILWAFLELAPAAV